MKLGLHKSIMDAQMIVWNAPKMQDSGYACIISTRVSSPVIQMIDTGLKQEQLL